MLHKPHYKAFWGLCDAVLFFKVVTIRYVLLSTILVGEKSLLVFLCAAVVLWGNVLLLDPIGWCLKTTEMVVLKDALFWGNPPALKLGGWVICWRIYCFRYSPKHRVPVFLNWMRLFFVYSDSIFEIISFESCIVIRLYFCEMRYASCTPSMWYLVKHEVPILLCCPCDPLFALCKLMKANSAKVAKSDLWVTQGQTAPEYIINAILLKWLFWDLPPTPHFRE